MYQALLTRRYLFSKVMPLLSAAAVMLSTAMVIIVWSVMGGFLSTLLSSGKAMIGDVSVEWAVQGIPRYERLIEMFEADELVAHATPAVETIGLITLPMGSTKPVKVVGIDPEGYDRVTGYFENLWWRPIDEPLLKDKKGEDPRLHEVDLMTMLERWGHELSVTDPNSGAKLEAMVPGVELVGGLYDRMPQGYLDPGPKLPGNELTLQVMPLSRRGVPIRPAARSFIVANEFRTGLYQADADWVLVPIATLQKMLMLDEAERVIDSGSLGAVRDEAGRETFSRPVQTRIEPARATTVLLSAAEGVSPDLLLPRAREVYQAFYDEVSNQGERPPSPASVSIYTWETKPGIATFISAVKNEIALVIGLFGFISMTAVFLVFAIFWSMVSEKTKDVGVLRALGASRMGIAWLFVRYGLAIGIVGSAAGGVLSLVIVRNINPIHQWLGSAMGIQIWKPEVYYFIEIPNKVDPLHASLVLGLGVLASALGAMAPALRAAFMDPVRALRFE